MAAAPNDRVEKIEHPEAFYASPDDVLKDSMLSAAEKKQALENWKRDAVEELVAADEGMPAPEGEMDAADDDMQKVAAAERRLDSESAGS